MNIVGRRKLWFAISIIIILPGIIALALWGLKPGIDFAGGQVMEVGKVVDIEKVKPIFEAAGARDISTTTTGAGLGGVGMPVRAPAGERGRRCLDS
jgi:preprotein translocase subunit SecF